MLVLKRKVNERVLIQAPTGDGSDLYIWVEIAGIHNAKVQLGIEAPKTCKILREEIIPSQKGSQ
jgi:carbon storage regulator CsrA